VTLVKTIQQMIAKFTEARVQTIWLLPMKRWLETIKNGFVYIE
jgi:hypothetical protein